MQRAILGCLTLLLAACGAPTEPAGSGPEAAPASGVIGDPLQKSLSKARTVDELSSQRKGGLDDAVDAAN